MTTFLCSTKKRLKRSVKNLPFLARFGLLRKVNTPTHLAIHFKFILQTADANRMLAARARTQTHDKLQLNVLIFWRYKKPRTFLAFAKFSRIIRTRDFVPFGADRNPAAALGAVARHHMLAKLKT